MSILVNGSNISVIHVRHDGVSHDIDTNSGDTYIEGEFTQEGLLTAVEDHLDLNRGVLSGYELDIVSATETAVIHPQAKFGK